MRSLVLKAKEERLLREVSNGVHEVESWSELVDVFFRGIQSSLRIDYAAVASPLLDGSLGLAWHKWNLERGFLAQEYNERLAGHDFVYQTTAASPNVVKRDPEMISRQGFHANELHHHARECGNPIERNMAVLIVDAQGNIVCGVSLYRKKDLSFTPHDAAFLQETVRPIRRAVLRLNEAAHERMRAERALSDRGDMLAVLDAMGAAIVIVGANGAEKYRSRAAEWILLKYFHSNERRGTQLPTVLLDELARRRNPPMGVPRDALVWVVGDNGALKVRFSPRDRCFHDGYRKSPNRSLVASGMAAPGDALRVRFFPLGRPDGAWVLCFDDLAWHPELPKEMAAVLPPFQQRCAALLGRGDAQKDIANELAWNLGAVKRTGHEVLRSLGVRDRAELVRWVALLQK